MVELASRAAVGRAGRVVPGILSLASTIAVPVVAGALFLAALGIDPLAVYVALIQGSLASPSALGSTLTKAAPLILAGLGVGFALRGGLFNLGGEGQIYMGATLSTAVALGVRGLPPLVHLPLALMAGFAGGAAWAALPALLRAKRGVNEIISTIMMNYVATWLVLYLLTGPMREPGGDWAQSAQLSMSARLPVISPAIPFHAGFLVALLAAVVVYVLMSRTTLGYQIKVIGSSPLTARYAGISVSRNIILAMLVSGGLAGVAGTGEILGTYYRLNTYFSPGYGYDAIAVAFLGKGDPIGMAIAGLFLGALRAGAQTMMWGLNVHFAFVWIIQGFAMLSVIAFPSLRERLGLFRRRG